MAIAMMDQRSHGDPGDRGGVGVPTGHRLCADAVVGYWRKRTPGRAPGSSGIPPGGSRLCAAPHRARRDTLATDRLLAPPREARTRQETYASDGRCSNNERQARPRFVLSGPESRASRRVTMCFSRLATLASLAQDSLRSPASCQSWIFMSPGPVRSRVVIGASKTSASAMSRMTSAGRRFACSEPECGKSTRRISPNS